jgi:hypothetical protein
MKAEQIIDWLCLQFDGLVPLSGDCPIGFRKGVHAAKDRVIRLKTQKFKENVDLFQKMSKAVWDMKRFDWVYNNPNNNENSGYNQGVSQSQRYIDQIMMLKYDTGPRFLDVECWAYKPKGYSERFDFNQLYDGFDP